MKMDIKSRMKNPWFWVGIFAVILNAMGVSASTFTSWERVYTAFMCLLTNPFQLGCVVLAVLAVFVDPSTSGFGDKLKLPDKHD